MQAGQPAASKVARGGNQQQQAAERTSAPASNVSGSKGAASTPRMFGSLTCGEAGEAGGRAPQRSDAACEPRDRSAASGASASGRE